MLQDIRSDPGMAHYLLKWAISGWAIFRKNCMWNTYVIIVWIQNRIRQTRNDIKSILLRTYVWIELKTICKRNAFPILIYCFRDFYWQPILAKVLNLPNIPICRQNNGSVCYRHADQCCQWCHFLNCKFVRFKKCVLRSKMTGIYMSNSLICYACDFVLVDF